MTPIGRHAWIDASAGLAGDMLLGALVDAGADLASVSRAIETVVPGAVALETQTVTRAGMRAVKIDVRVLVDDPPHRTWRTIRDLLTAGDLPASVRDNAVAVFARLAAAEGEVHGIPAEDVHFHEVGALDSIADVVGVCAAVAALGVTSLSTGSVSLGSGSITTSHGHLPVPVPAVAQLAQGWRVQAGGPGELTTPTGMALLTTLCAESTELPAMHLDTVGIGAGTKDTPGRANVIRVLVGHRTGPRLSDVTDPAVLLEANVDDLDPRLWPGILARLLQAGASDAWLVPIVMKKGRPAHTLCALGHPDRIAGLRDCILTETSTLGVRQHDLRKYALPRSWVDVEITDGIVPVKIAHRDGTIVQVTPEFEAVAGHAARSGRPEQAVLVEVTAAAQQQGWTVGAPAPAEESSR